MLQTIDSGQLPFLGLTDDEVSERLRSIHGVGAWSVEQILFWHLERPDVLVTGDPAVMRAVQSAYGLQVTINAEASKKEAMKTLANQIVQLSEP